MDNTNEAANISVFTMRSQRRGGAAAPALCVQFACFIVYYVCSHVHIQLGGPSVTKMRQKKW